MDHEETRQVLCGDCRVSTEIRVDGDAQRVICPDCGQSDEVEDAWLEAAKHKVTQALDIVVNGLGGGGGSRLLKPPVTSAPKRSFRWVMA